MPLTPVEILESVRALFVRQPSLWIKGAWSRDGGCCLSGAFDVVAGDAAGGHCSTWRNSYRDAKHGRVTTDPTALAFLALARVVPGGNVVAANDHQDTKLEHVLAWLSEAIQNEGKSPT